MSANPTLPPRTRHLPSGSARVQDETFQPLTDQPPANNGKAGAFRAGHVAEPGATRYPRPGGRSKPSPDNGIETVLMSSFPSVCPVGRSKPSPDNGIETWTVATWGLKIKFIWPQ